MDLVMDEIIVHQNNNSTSTVPAWAMGMVGVKTNTATHSSALGSARRSATSAQQEFRVVGVARLGSLIQGLIPKSDTVQYITVHTAKRKVQV